MVPPTDSNFSIIFSWAYFMSLSIKSTEQNVKYRLEILEYYQYFQVDITYLQKVYDKMRNLFDHHLEG